MKIVAAVIGTGIGLKHIEAIDSHFNSNVKIICEFNKKKVQIIKKKFASKIIVSNENEIFKDKTINLVSIASYDENHFSQIIKCIRNKKNVIVEKPMCLNFAQLKKIKQELKKNKKIKIFSNLVLRVNDLFKKIKNQVNKKKIYYIEADYIWGRKEKLFGWRSKNKQYSITTGAGIHMIDLINWILETNPTHVTAFSNKKFTKNTIFKKDSFNVAILEYPEEILAKVTSNCYANYKHFHELKIFSKNQTYIHNVIGKTKFLNKKRLPIKGNYPDKINRGKLIHNFLNVLQKKEKKEIISTREQFDLMAICFALDNSIKFNKRQKIKYV